MKFIIIQLQPPFLCGKLPTGFEIQIKTDFQPKGSIDCTQAAHSPAAELSGGCQGPHWGFVLRKAAALQYPCCISPTLSCSCVFFLKSSSTFVSSKYSLNCLRPSLLPSLASDSRGGVWASRKVVLCIQQVWVPSTVSSLTSINFFPCSEQD